VGLGIVLPLLGFHVQAGSLAAFPFAALLPCFIVGYVGNINTGLPDYPSDRASGKRSYAVRVGQSVARRHSLELLAVGALFSPLVLTHARWPWLVGAALGPLVVLSTNLSLLGSADAEQRAQCHRFVTVNAIALNLLLVTWLASALLTGSR
jgi:1,4-dihydroxy-2-naphthoate octaprenyltransferase